MDERDLNTWRVRIDHVEEVRENVNSNNKYAVFILDIQRPDPNSGKDRMCRSIDHGDCL